MLGGPVQHNLGYGYNFAFGMACSLLAIAWCVFFVKDSKELRDARLREELGLDDSKDINIDVKYIENGRLLESHQYFTQIQLQMYVCQAKETDLFIYSSVDYKIIRVKYDADFA